MDLLIHILLRVSEMICALPEIQEMDINPIIINDKKAVAVDARMVIAPALSDKPFYHLAIHPYPDDLITSCEIAGKKITLRPIRQEDAEMEQSFIRHLSPETKYFRFIENINELPLAMLVRFTHMDYDREMAFVACQEEDGEESMIGIVRYSLNPDAETAEFSIVVADSWQDKGLGSKLMDVLIKTAKNKGLKEIEGVVLATNHSMLEFAKYHGFEIIHDDDPTLKIIKLNLSPPPP
jgi:acetyltransferase